MPSFPFCREKVPGELGQQSSTFAVGGRGRGDLDSVSGWLAGMHADVQLNLVRGVPALIHMRTQFAPPVAF